MAGLGHAWNSWIAHFNIILSSPWTARNQQRSQAEWQ